MDNHANCFQPLNCKSGTDYELWVLNLLILVGIKARRTGKDDNGVDIVAEVAIGETLYKFYIQCKFHNKTIGKEPIQEVFTGCTYYGNDGYPVVITNNYMTADAEKYAKALGVEVIGQLEFDEIATIVRNQLAVNDIKKHSGLFGIIIGRYIKDEQYVDHSVSGFHLLDESINQRADVFTNDLTSIFDEAESLTRQSNEMQRKAMVMYERALNLQKEALIMHLKYPDSSLCENVLGGLSMADIFDKLLESVDSLSPEQFQKLYSVMEKRKVKEENKVSDFSTSSFMPCPNCGSVETKKYGKVRGKQRFLCKDCKKTFGYSTGTVIINSRANKPQWEIMLRGFVTNQSVYEISKEVGLSPSSVWLNRIKLCMAIMSLYGTQDNFVDIAECDEYYAPVSFKGKRDPAFFIDILGRLPRHHWGRQEKIDWLIKNGFYSKLCNDPEKLEALLNSNKKRGISDDQTCILTCQDRSGHLLMVPVGVGSLETEDVRKSLAGRFPTDGIMVTDSHKAYPKFAAEEKIQLEQISSNKHTKGAFNLSRINALHSNLAAYWNKDKENIPATKYMDLSLIFLWWLRKNKELSINEKVKKLYEIITDPKLQIDTQYETIKNREITLNTKNLIPKDIKKL